MCAIHLMWFSPIETTYPLPLFFFFFAAWLDGHSKENASFFFFGKVLPIPVASQLVVKKTALAAYLFSKIILSQQCLKHSLLFWILYLNFMGTIAVLLKNCAMNY